jgi:hypothetical protein
MRLLRTSVWCLAGQAVATILGAWTYKENGA